jgi:pimeloyl-ACP methyl ester carboxylesterase
MPTVRDRFASFDGLRFHFLDWQGPSEDSPLLVLLHGGLGDAHGWDLFAPFPELVRRLVIVDVSPVIPRWTGTPRNRFVSPEDAFSERLDPSRGKDETVLQESVERNLMLMADGTFSWRYDVDGLHESFKNRDIEGGWRLLERITASTLVVRGAESNLLTPELAQRMCRAIANARLVEIPGAGHPVSRDQPALFLAAVASFLFGD